MNGKPIGLGGATTVSGQDNQGCAAGGMTDRVVQAMQGMLLLSRINRIYGKAAGTHDQSHFLDRILELLGVSAEISGPGKHLIPSQGPLIVVANHPFGGIEGLILARMLLGIRADVRVMANYLLQRIPDLKDLFIGLDPFVGAPHSVRRNVSGLRRALAWLSGGGSLIIFPAGEVAHLQVRRGRVSDPSWSPSVGWLARRAEATVVPVFVDGRNSGLFQIAGLVHPSLRTALLPREVLNKKGRVIRASIGHPVQCTTLGAFASDGGVTTYLRLRAHSLKAQKRSVGEMYPLSDAFPGGTVIEPIAGEMNRQALIREIEGLDRGRILAVHRNFLVFEAAAQQIPKALYEIGRLREITFRSAGEGTGKAVDLDRYDLYYRHLFLWDSEQNRIAGAYRLGLVDEIVKRFGAQGLYVNSLFHMKPAFLDHISDGIELGRSFVHPAYQKQYAPLLLLWKAIGRFVVDRPKYRTLYGPVTISSRFDVLSRHLMVHFLMLNHYAPDLAGLVAPRRPIKSSMWLDREVREVSRFVRSIDDLTYVVADMERDRKELPVLLRQYIRLGGKVLGFTIDHAFAEGLDGLIFVDLRECDRKILGRYMGEEGATSFLRCHGLGQAELRVA